MFQNPIQMIQMFKSFFNNYTPQKAYDEMQQYIASGKVTQEQLNELQVKANEFIRLLNGFR